MPNVKRNVPFYRIYHQNAFYIEFFTELRLTKSFITFLPHTIKCSQSGENRLLMFLHNFA